MKKNSHFKLGSLILLALILVFGQLPLGAKIFAQPDVIEISTADQLISLANTKWNEKDEAFSKQYKLVDNIDLDGKDFKGLGDSSNKFTGIFDGNGYTISNFNTKSNAGSGEQGFINFLDKTGILKNLTFDNAKLTYGKSSGIAIGCNAGKVENVVVKNSVLTTNQSTCGLVASVNEGSIKNTSVIDSELISTNVDYGTTHGGLVGRNKATGSLESVLFDGTISAQKWAGGIVGWNYGKISNAYATGQINGTEKIGGLVGRNNDRTQISTSIANVNLSVKENLAGPVIGEENYGGGKQEDVVYNSENKFSADAPVLKGTIGKTANKLKDLSKLPASFSASWEIRSDVNNGYPLPKGCQGKKSQVIKPETAKATVYVMNYNPDTLTFVPLAKSPQTLEFKEEDILLDVMDKNKMDYVAVDGAYGKYITTMSGVKATGKDGWMFTINDQLAPTGISTQKLKDGDELIFYYGSQLNNYNGPSLAEVKNKLEEYSGEKLEGKGTKENPFLIKTEEDFKEIEKNLGAYYKLDQDIDLKGKDFQPIGSKSNPFTGVFNGNNHIIKGLSINKGKDEDNIGLFAALKDAKIFDLTIKDAAIDGGANLGILAGYSEESTVIKGVSVSGKIRSSYDKIAKKTNIGGLVGYNNGNQNNSYKYSIIDRCEATIEIITPSDKCGNIGGLVGYNNGHINKSKSSGRIKGGVIVGGLAGVNSHIINDSVSSVNIEGDYTLGGFVGLNHFTGILSDNASLGLVIPTDTGSAQNIGGFAGSASGKLEGNISLAKVLSGYSWNGAFAGNFDGEVKNFNNNFSVNEDINGSPIKTIGNAVDPISELSKISKQIGKTSQEMAELAKQKNLDVPTMMKDTAKAELDKYEDQVAIGKEIAANVDITNQVIKLKKGKEANPEAKIYLFQEDYKGYITDKLPKGKFKLIKQNETEKRVQEQIYMAILLDGEYASKKIRVDIESQKASVVTPNEPNKPNEPSPSIGTRKPRPSQKPTISQPIQDIRTEEKKEDSITVKARSPFDKMTDLVNHWAKNVIKYVMDQGYFTGTSETTFSPDRPITRGEFVTVLGRRAKIDANKYPKSKMLDMEPGAYYEPYINWALSEGILQGVGGQKVEPNRRITREEMATILNRYLEKQNKTYTRQKFTIYVDHKKISSWAEEAVNKLSREGLLAGRDNHYFVPKGNFTRGEAAQVLYNLDNK